MTSPQPRIPLLDPAVYLRDLDLLHRCNVCLCFSFLSCKGNIYDKFVPFGRVGMARSVQLERIINREGSLNLRVMAESYHQITGTTQNKNVCLHSSVLRGSIHRL
jgi:hypothetical protein